MKEQYNDGPAFPVHGYNGMTLRDYFAAAALPIVYNRFVNKDDKYEIDCDSIAIQAYLIADEMLKERLEANR